AIVGPGLTDDPSCCRLLVTTDEKRWKDITPRGLHHVLESIDFLDPLHAWVGAWDCGDNNGDLLITSDGGRHWQTVVGRASHTCHAASEAAFDFVDARHGTLA